MKKKYYLLSIMVLMLSFFVNAQKELQTELLGATRVTNEGEGGLYFAGRRDVNYRFSQRITPHGDCVDVVNGYAFVTWYKGGMADGRNLMLSRKNLNVANSDWVTIEFPHKHIGQGGELLNGTGIRGDSHNTAAIGVSTIDNTIHILYDMHAYRSSALPNDFFNYSVSKANTAFVPDNEFTLDIFNPKQNYLKQGENYERITYPMLHRADDGSLVARYRVGGSGNGDILMAHYNGTSWTDNWLFQRGMQPVPDRNSLYGGERFLNGRFYSGYAIRYSTNNDINTSNGFFINSGLYFAYTNEVPKGRSSQWFDVNDSPISIPIRNRLDETADPVKIAEPGTDHGVSEFPRTSADPSWTVTENGAIHFITRVDNINVHYYRAPGATTFSSNAGGLIPNPEVRGEMYSYKNHVFMVELIAGRIIVKTTLEGENNWKIVYTGREATRYNHFDAFVEGDRLYVYLMEDTQNNTPGEGDSRPLYFQVFELSEIDTVPEVTPEISLEAESFTSASPEVSVSTNTAASNGQIIGSFGGGQFLEYRFQVETEGDYRFRLFAANRNRDDSTMDIEINGIRYENVLITRTFDWNIFLETVIPDVTLVQGENIVRLTQKRALSSRPDKLDFTLNSTFTLSTDTVDDTNSLLVYPNPSSGKFQIESRLKALKYTVFNIQGQLVKQGSVENKGIDMLGYPQGVYVLELVSDGKRILKKIVIE